MQSKVPKHGVKSTLSLDLLLVLAQICLIGLIVYIVARFDVIWAFIVLIVGLLGIPLDLGVLELAILRMAAKRGWDPNFLFRIDVDTS